MVITVTYLMMVITVTYLMIVIRVTYLMMVITVTYLMMVITVTYLMMVTKGPRQGRQNRLKWVSKPIVLVSTLSYMYPALIKEKRNFNLHLK
jgi:hypothetical protein